MVNTIFHFLVVQALEWIPTILVVPFFFIVTSIIGTQCHVAGQLDGLILLGPLT
jgi:hypothetical protein